MGAALSGTRRRPAAEHRPERTADLGVLAVGLILAMCGAIALIHTMLRAPHNPRRVVDVALYATGLIAMFGFSLCYRAATEPRRRQLLRRLDHAAIFAMIAGSATPFALIGSDRRGAAVAAAVWAVAAVGIAVKFYFPLDSVRRSAALYVVLGWAVLFGIGPRFRGETAMLITAGGILYSAGLPFLLWWRLPYWQAIWHLFVLAGAACQYAAILGVVVSG